MNLCAAVVLTPRSSSCRLHAFGSAILLWGALLIGCATTAAQPPQTKRRSPVETPCAAGPQFSPDGTILAEAVTLMDDDHIYGRVKLRDAHTHKVLRTFDNPEGQFTSIAFSPDGTLLAGAEMQLEHRQLKASAVRLWNVASGKPLPGVFADGFDDWDRVAFSPDGKSLLLVRLAFEGNHIKHGLVQWWDVQSGRPQHVLPLAEGEYATAAAYSPDGKLLAVAVARQQGDKSPGELQVWDGSGQTMKYSRTGLPALTLALAFSPDGRYIATGGGDPLRQDSDQPSEVRLWDAETGMLQRTIVAHKGAVLGLAFSLDSRTLASASQDHMVKLWDVATSDLRRNVGVHCYGALGVVFAPDGHTLVSNGMDGLKWWRTDDNTESSVRLLLSHGGNIEALAFAPDGKTLATGSGRMNAADARNGGQATGSGAITIWDPVTESAKLTLSGHKSSVKELAYSPDGRLLASAAGGVDNAVLLWNTATDKLAGTLTHGCPIDTIAFSGDGRWLATGGVRETAQPDNTHSGTSIISLWDTSTGKIARTWNEPGFRVRQLAFGQNGATLAECGDRDVPGSEVRLRLVATGELQRTLLDRREFATAMAVSPDGASLVTGGYIMEGQTFKPHIYVWNVETGEPREIAVPAAMTAGDDEADADALGLGSARWQRMQEHLAEIQAVAFSPDGKRLAGSSRSAIYLWNPGTGELLRQLPNPCGGGTGLAFAPNGNTVAITAIDGTVRLWDLAAQNPGK